MGRTRWMDYHVIDTGDVCFHFNPRVPTLSRIISEEKSILHERACALSLGLGLTPPFLLTLLNTTLEVKVNFISALLVFLISCIIGILVFLKRGGNLNLISWYKSKD